MIPLMHLDLVPGTLHRLRNRHNEKGEDKVFEWTGSAWSTPGTRWGTKSAMMQTVGWRYVGPVDSN